MKQHWVWCALAAVVAWGAQGGEGLQLQIVAKQTGQVEITWPSIPGAEYALETTESLAEPWQRMEGDQPVLKAASNTLCQVLQASASGGFYRVTPLVITNGMVLIPAGTFWMGDSLNDDSESFERPVHMVTLDAFYMDRTEVTWAFWKEVRDWALQHGYRFTDPGAGKADNHPVQSIDWYDAAKWCNARSEKEGRVPAYYTGTNMSPATAYRVGLANVRSSWVNWTAGYRLPTEAEWEYASRGGLAAKRFPWGNTITHSQANYLSLTNFAYDLSPTRRFHPSYATGNKPYTSPVGSFAANGFGLYDMAGNLFEWCWDYYEPYRSMALTNPRGASLSQARVVRSNSWNDDAAHSRSAFRGYTSPSYASLTFGFRSVLPAEP